MDREKIEALLANRGDLIARVQNVLFEEEQVRSREPRDDAQWTRSAVLFVLGNVAVEGEQTEPSLILTQRSRAVRQAGDLCCPGGGIAPRIDPWLARAVALPGFPLRKWIHYRDWKANGHDMGGIPLILTAALREAYEEVRLSPLRTRFLGMLPPQRLRLLKRAIHPAVVWMTRMQRFRPNWEVERVVIFSLRELLDPSHYARFHIRSVGGMPELPARMREEFGCFRSPRDPGLVLWGATYQVTLRFLNMVFEFVPPAGPHLPLVEGDLDRAYLTGSR